MVTVDPLAAADGGRRVCEAMGARTRLNDAACRGVPRLWGFSREERGELGRRRSIDSAGRSGGRQAGFQRKRTGEVC
jgi:hypothetical protein